ncbi:hypothetical protein llap_9018 [Limosa lapponica baueri]|uniref:Uncharacterized protein n=1 Tax=Limosa lapponica baueri TaxID=1758121 RepID=A0A2I0U3S0_LIMLA|nr:hypothetical protein llap_9018 [Limosa lapponica baueri]
MTTLAERAPGVRPINNRSDNTSDIVGIVGSGASQPGIPGEGPVDLLQRRSGRREIRLSQYVHRVTFVATPSYGRDWKTKVIVY